MTLSLTAYKLFTGVLEPFSGHVLRGRVKAGKEDRARLPERKGRTELARPEGPLVWLHGASVGETALLLSIYRRLKAKRPDLNALFTSQTLTAAQMFARADLPDAVHQMAPVDAPGAVKRFLTHWRPDAIVLAEGEIWPNALMRAQRMKIPMALVNARMTPKTLKGWQGRKGAARRLFGGFGFIGAADQQTADGLSQLTRRDIDTVGNLKLAAPPPRAPYELVQRWRTALNGRPVLLAASTHTGEDTFAIDAFRALRRNGLDPLLIVAPRHPERAASIAEELRAARLTFKARTGDGTPGADDPVLLADTIGEMGLWLELADAVYLGGATRNDVGGHNPIEPAQLGKPVFTGPFAYNFTELMAKLESAGAVTTGTRPEALAAFWASHINGTDVRRPDPDKLDAVFRSVEAPLLASLDAICTMLDARVDA